MSSDFMSNRKQEKQDAPLELDDELNEKPPELGEIEKDKDHASSELLNGDQEWRCLLRKIDLHLVPQLFFLSMFTAIVRSNIGNAQVAGLMDTIDITDDQYNWAVSAIFISDVFFELPSNLFLKTVGASTYFSLVLLIEGVIACASAMVKTGPQLIAVRFFLGLVQAGVIAGLVFYSSLWYPKREQSLRIAIFFGGGGVYVTGAVGGLLAYGIVHMDGLQELRGWQWIFIIEGIPSLIFAVITFFTLPNGPEKARFLNDRERIFLANRIKIDAGPATEIEFSKRQMVSVFRDWKLYSFCAITFCTMMTTRSIVMFLPTIIRGFGFDPVTTQAMTVPPYIAGFVFALLVSASSDRFLERGFHLTFCVIVGIVGFILLIALRNNGIAGLYVGVHILVCGIFATVSVRLSWISSSFGGHTKRVVALAVITAIGTVGSIIGGQAYRADDAPQYVRGNGIMLGVLGSVIITAPVTKFGLWRSNINRSRMSAEEHATAILGEDLCDNHPDYRYVL